MALVILQEAMSILNADAFSNEFAVGIVLDRNKDELLITWC